MPPAKISEPSVGHLLAVQRRVQVIVIGLLSVALIVGAYALTQNKPQSSVTLLLARTDTGAGTAYNDLFQASFRPDAGQGNIAIGAVYFHPALQQALTTFTQKSAHQQDVSRVLSLKGANADGLAFYLLVDSVVSQVDLDFSKNVSLSDGQGRTYALKSWDKILSPLAQEQGQVRNGSLLFFDVANDQGARFSNADAKSLTLTIKDVDRVPARTFAWQLSVFPQ